jgi:hypothetical protein
MVATANRADVAREPISEHLKNRTALPSETDVGAASPVGTTNGGVVEAGVLSLGVMLNLLE